MKKIMLGNEAFARGAYEAGVHVVSSYPGTPSTEVTEFLARYEEPYVEWAPNEKVALEVAVGASIAGARAMSCMKHVGLNVAADPLFTSSYEGVNGGLVVLVADDPGCHSSQNEQDSRFYARAAGIPMLEPADSAEAREFAMLGFDLSEEYDLPVLLRSNTRLSHSRGIVEMQDRKEVPLRVYEKNVQKYVMMPAMAVKAHISLEQRLNRLREAAGQSPLNRVERRGRQIGVITSGVCYQYVKEALPDASILKLGMVYPLPDDLIRDFANSVETLYVIEELEPFIEQHVRAMGIHVIGKEIFTIQGEYSVNFLKKAVLGQDTEHPEAVAAPGRPPILCPGCPHRAVFYTLSKLKKTVCGDIGCYTLGTLAPLAAVDTCLCMGGSISMALGMEKARGKDFAKNLVAVIGDSTFLHSGVTGLIDMYYSGATSTVMILDNSITGMTGHQDNPATGKDAKGNPAPQVDLTALVRGIGVEHVREVDPFDLPALTAAIREETAREALSVIITKRPCALIVKQPRIKYQSTDACKNCGACLKLGCPAIIRTETGVHILPETCVGCGLCEGVCAFHAIVEVEK